jgi:hypothetical protein
MDWSKRADDSITSLPPNGRARDWRIADKQTIGKALEGVRLYGNGAKPDAGARVAFNISSAHIPGFAANRNGSGYKNRYDVSGKQIGDAPPSSGLGSRELIDQLLAKEAGRLQGRPVKPETLYYGAVELNGSGVRYYGDVSLILLPHAHSAKDKRLVLDRNSFDLISSPLLAKTCPNKKWNEAAASKELATLAGEWSADLVNMAICKIFGGGPNTERRITVGAVSEGLLADEDYIEVIRTSSFDVTNLAEARVSAADAALDGVIADRLRRGPRPNWAELMWRHRRRKADQALRSQGIVMRVVISAGRVRT